MSSTPLIALVTGAIVFSYATAQEPSPEAPARRILMLEGTQPPLEPLRAAIRAGDAVRSASLGEEFGLAVRISRSELARAVEKLGGEVVEHFWIVDGCVVEVPATAVDGLGALPGVVRVWKDEPRRPGDMPMPMPIKTSTNTNNHGTDTVQARGVRGAGVTVAVVDSGLDERMGPLPRPHSTFFVNGNPSNTTGGGIGGSRILANVQVGTYPADDPIDHGTRVAGVAAGAIWNSSAAADDGHAPDAKLVGYGLVDMGNGYSAVATITRAWQQCTLDAARYGTKVAVISYDGYFDPLAPDQQAMDACAELADIAIAAMAGNDQSTQIYYTAATNVLAVGAVVRDTHVATYFTALGPLRGAGGTARTYPNLVANGQDIVMPSADAEASSVTRNGTSYSAPQVAGAAALFRSVATTATADETRAAILATVDDARAANPSAENAIGHGYLRVDRLVDLAQGRIPGLVSSGRVAVNAPVWTTRFQASQGDVFAVALAFSRRIVASLEWANLDLRISQNGMVLAESSGLWDTHERVAFRAPATGTVDVAVIARRFGQGTVVQDFGIAVAQAPLPLLTTYGSGCPGARGPSSVREVEPMVLHRPGSFGNSSSDLLIGGTPHRTQQWITTDAPSAAFHVTGLALRHDDLATSGPWTRSWVELDATINLTMNQPANMSTMFAQNLDRLAVQVIARKRFVLPAIAAPNTHVDDFRVVLPLDQNFSRQYDPVGPTGGSVFDMIVDVRTYATSAGAQPLSYPLDAVSNFPGVVTLHAPSPTATTGTLTQGVATVIGLVDTLGNAVIPTLTTQGAPALGASYALRVEQARANTAAFLTVGASNSSAGGIALPLDLGFLGAPGCYVLTSLDMTLAGTTNASGYTTFSIPVPATAALTGANVFHQGLVSDPDANALGLVTTPAVRATVGR